MNEDADYRSQALDLAKLLVKALPPGVPVEVKLAALCVATGGAYAVTERALSGDAFQIAALTIAERIASVGSKTAIELADARLAARP